MSKNSKILRFFVFCLFEASIVLAFFIISPIIDRFPPTIGNYHYAPPNPYPNSIDEAAYPPPVIPCLEKDIKDKPGSILKNPEFHSLRPYQASPCGDNPQAYFCNNDYTIIEELTRKWDSNWCWYGSVVQGQETSSPSYFCRMEPNASIANPDSPTGFTPVYIIGEQDGRDYALTVNEVEYPFLGNTEDMLNSQSKVGSDELYDEVGKMNEYVNWYLQGVIEKAEYGLEYPRYPGNERNVDAFAGPAKKLLPFDILNLRRLEVLHDAGVQVRFDVDSDFQAGDLTVLYYDADKQIWYYEESLNHNHIAVCTSGFIPIPCYDGGGKKANGSIRRLVGWWEAKGSVPWETYYESRGNKFLNWTDYDSWGGATPPFPWLFADKDHYLKALLEWSGRDCVIIPGVDNLICSLWVPNVWSLNYEFVPLGNSVDKNAGHGVYSVIVRGSGQTIIKLLGYEILHVPVLHYPHTEATVQVSELLNNINTPLECEEPTEELEELEGEGEMCCPSGFSYAQGACANNNAINICNTFGTALCESVETIDPLAICDSEYASGLCLNAAIEGSFITEGSSYPEFVCSNITSLMRLTWMGQVLQTACEVGLNLAFNALTLLNITTDIECNSGLACQEGACVNPRANAPLNCSRIEGIGKNYEPTTCEFTEVRSNPGDSLTFGNKPSLLFIEDVRTRVDVIECRNKNAIQNFLNDAPFGCDGTTWNVCLTEKCATNPICEGVCPAIPVPGYCTSVPDCDAEVTVTIPTTPKIPYIDQIWMNTVVNRNTSFRRIFPKFGEETPVQCIKEIPGTSPVTYKTNWETNLTRIDTAGPTVCSGGGVDSQSSCQLFFPHLGTIYEYFLKGIQTALRPRGFGNGPLPQGEPENCITEELGDCKMWLFEPYKGGQIVYDKIIQAAANVSCNGKQLSPFWAVGIALNENAGLMTNDADGDSPTHFGCSVCEVGTIDQKMECMMNTLRNDCVEGKEDWQILCEYGYTEACGGEDYVIYPVTVLMGGAGGDTSLFGSNFNVGQLVQNLTNTDWEAVYPDAAETFCQDTPYFPPSAC